VGLLFVIFPQCHFTLSSLPSVREQSCNRGLLQRIYTLSLSLCLFEAFSAVFSTSTARKPLIKFLARYHHHHDHHHNHHHHHHHHNHHHHHQVTVAAVVEMEASAWRGCHNGPLFLACPAAESACQADVSRGQRSWTASRPWLPWLASHCSVCFQRPETDLVHLSWRRGKNK